MNAAWEVELPVSNAAATADWSNTGGDMALNVHCAYNQTREAFLGLQVTVADIPFGGFDKLMEHLVLKSGEGLWLSPFRGIPNGDVHAPLDLIYLDPSCRVIELLEGFPTVQSSASVWPASVLVLPAYSIFSSQTQVGDQLLLCMAEEMGRRLDGLADEPVAAPAEPLVQGAVLLREKPLWSEGPGIAELEEQYHIATAPPLKHEMELVQPGTRAMAAQRNWLQRWWSPDPRKAPREAAPGLAAYYWNGSSPKAHSIRDISESGLYVVTEERWYPGTLLLMTLQRTDCGEEAQERSIAVQSRAVRWGQDGVGLQFILPEPQDAKRGISPLLDGADRKQFERFLEQLKKGK